MRFRELKLRKNPDCPVCGDAPDASRSSSTTSSSAASRGRQRRRRRLPACPRSRSRGAEGAARRRRRRVRPRRARAARVPDRQHRRAPHPARRSAQAHRRARLPSREIIVHCRSGARSAKAVTLLARSRLHQRQEPHRRHPRLVRQDRSHACRSTRAERRARGIGSEELGRVTLTMTAWTRRDNEAEKS